MNEKTDTSPREFHRVSFTISPQLHGEMMDIARSTGETLSGVIRRAMLALVATHQANGKGAP